MNPLIFVSKPALILYASIALIASYYAWERHITSKAIASCEAAQNVASAKLEAAVSNIGTQAVEGVASANQNDRPIVRVAADSVRNACKVRDTASAPIAHDSSRQAQDDRARKDVEQWLSDAADDIETCQAELNRFEGLQKERAAITTNTE